MVQRGRRVTSLSPDASSGHDVNFTFECMFSSEPHLRVNRSQVSSQACVSGPLGKRPWPNQHSREGVAEFKVGVDLSCRDRGTRFYRVIGDCQMALTLVEVAMDNRAPFSQRKLKLKLGLKLVQPARRKARRSLQRRSTGWVAIGMESRTLQGQAGQRNSTTWDGRMCA